MNARRISRPIGVRTGMFLQIRLADEMRPCCGDGLVKPGMDAPVAPRQPEQTVDIGALELGDLPIEQNLFHGGVQFRQLAEGVRVGGIAARSLLF